MANLIKNIVAVSYIETSKLQNLVYIPRIGVRLQYWRDWQDLEIYGLASAEVTSKIEKKSNYTQPLLRSPPLTIMFWLPNIMLFWPNAPMAAGTLSVVAVIRIR